MRTHESDKSDTPSVVEAYDKPAPVPADIAIVTDRMSGLSTGSKTKPEASAGTLESTIDKIKQLLAAGKFRNEAEISLGVVIPILADLDWPVFDVQIVAPEFKIGARKADYALCKKPRKPSVLLEVKDLGKATDKGVKQLFEYCFEQGVQIAVLTDGQKWSLYLPAGHGGFEERRFAQIDLIVDDLPVAAGILTNYLHRKEILSGEGIKRAWRDYEAAQLQDVAASKYAPVWRKLLSGPNPSLLKLFLEEVQQETLEEVPHETEVNPDPTRAAGFLRAQAGLAAKPAGQPKEGKKRSHGESSSNNQPSLTFRGQSESFESSVGLMIAIFEKLASENPEFCERFSEKFYGKTRNYLAKTKAQLYPGKPQFQKLSHPLPGGWWLATHCSNRTKVRWIKHACKVAGLEFGKDLVVHIPSRTAKKQEQPAS